MSDLDPVTGLPKELTSFEDIVREQQKLNIFVDSRRYGKKVTIIEGINSRDLNIEKTAAKLKSTCACGGTVKDGKIELQGDHRQKVKETLEKMGFSVEVQ